jgi:hypothetical protein
MTLSCVSRHKFIRESSDTQGRRLQRFNAYSLYEAGNRLQDAIEFQLGRIGDDQ